MASEWRFPTATLLLIATLFILFQYKLRRGTSLRSGTTIPNISFQYPDGRESSLEKLRGTVLLIHFWAGWCEPCRQEMPLLKHLENVLSEKPFQILAINVEDTPVSQEPWGSDFPRPQNFVFDYSKSDLDPYDIAGIPVSILVDKEGKIRSVYLGPQDWGHRSYRSEIEALL